MASIGYGMALNQPIKQKNVIVDVADSQDIYGKASRARQRYRQSPANEGDINGGMAISRKMKPTISIMHPDCGHRDSSRTLPGRAIARNAEIIASKPADGLQGHPGFDDNDGRRHRQSRLVYDAGAGERILVMRARR